MALLLTAIAALSGGTYVALTDFPNADSEPEPRHAAPSETPTDARPGKTEPAVVPSETVLVSGTHPDGRLDLVPIVGAKSAGGSAPVVAAAYFAPPEPGSRVMIQRRSGGSWDTVAWGKQDTAGSFRAPLPPDLGVSGTFRAVSVPDAGRPGLATAEVQAGGPQLYWREEFAGRKLDATKWDHRHLGLRAGSRACSETSPRAVAVSSGRLHLRVRPIPGAGRTAQCPHGQYYNGHIGTHQTFSFRYGVLAARIRFPREDGQHGAFWSQPAVSEVDEHGLREDGAEIDVVEYFGDDFQNGAIQHSVYFTSDGKLRKLGGAENRNHLLRSGRRWSSDFQVFSVEWSPEEYIFRINGHETFRARRGVSHLPQYLILSLLTSDWELPRLDDAQPSPMEVDWVRVWKPRSSDPNAGPPAGVAD